MMIWAKLIRMAIFLLFVTLLLATQANSDGLNDLVAANNDFGLKLYNKFAEEETGNIIFSPLSISLAFAMTSLGAKGNTLQEIHSTIATGIPEVQIHKYFQQILKVIPRISENEHVSIANKLYGQKEFKILSSFLESSQRYYDSNLQTIDFKKRVQSASIINNWVSQKTNEKIKEIINPEDLSELTRLILINALYFRAQWDTPFNEYLTKPQKFYTTPKNPVETDFLHDSATTGFYGVHESLHFEILEKPFESHAFRFGIILPNLAKTSIDKVEKKLSAITLKSLELHSVTANVTMPKFKLQSSFELTDNLKTFGIQDLFVAGKADLTGLGDSKRLHITKALHKAVIEIDENGVVAAAVTALMEEVDSAFEYPNPEVTFRADHPFLFYIKHVDTDSILFLGRFSKP